MSTWFEWLVLERHAVCAGELWRLWSGHLVHVGSAHALMNFVACGLLLFMAVRIKCWRGLLLNSLWWMPVISLGLLAADSRLQWYAGLSGLLHGWAVWLLLHSRSRLAWLLLAVLIGKMIWEAKVSRYVDGVMVVTLAHRLGALLALSCVFVQRVYRHSMSGASVDR